MILRYLRGCFRLLFLFLFFLTHSYTHLNAAAAAAAEAHEAAFDSSKYPLGGTWRANFGESCDAIHRELCKREMSVWANASKN